VRVAAVRLLGHVALTLTGAARLQLGEPLGEPLLECVQLFIVGRAILGGAALGDAVQRRLRARGHLLERRLAVLLALCVALGLARLAVSGAFRQLRLARLESLLERIEPRRVGVIRQVLAEVGQSRQPLLDVFLQPRQSVRPLAFSLTFRNNCMDKLSNGFGIGRYKLVSLMRTCFIPKVRLNVIMAMIAMKTLTSLFLSSAICPIKLISRLKTLSPPSVGF